MDRAQSEKALGILVKAGLMKKAKADEIMRHLEARHAKLLKDLSGDRSRGGRSKGC